MAIYNVDLQWCGDGCRASYDTGGIQQIEAGSAEEAEAKRWDEVQAETDNFEGWTMREVESLTAVATLAGPDEPGEEFEIAAACACEGLTLGQVQMLADYNIATAGKGVAGLVKLIGLLLEPRQPGVNKVWYDCYRADARTLLARLDGVDSGAGVV